MSWKPATSSVEVLSTPRSLNNKFIVEIYKKGAIRTKVENGFAFVEQKSALKGLRLLVDAKLSDGTLVPKGHVVYIREEILHTQQWAQKSMELDFLNEPCLIVDATYVELVAPPQEVVP